MLKDYIILNILDFRELAEDSTVSNCRNGLTTVNVHEKIISVYASAHSPTENIDLYLILSSADLQFRTVINRL